MLKHSLIQNSKQYKNKITQYLKEPLLLALIFIYQEEVIIKSKRNKHNKIIIGIDQSYTKTGISICIDGKLVKVSSINFKGCSKPSEKRNELRRVLTLLLPKALEKASECVIYCERIRTFSNFGNSKHSSGGMHPNFLKMSGALLAVIVDTAFDYGIEVYSVDTRSWKSKIVGSSKAKVKDGKRDAKSETVKYVQNLGFDLFIREKKSGKNKGEKIYDDDAADSACIALYGFLPKSKQNIKLET